MGIHLDEEEVRRFVLRERHEMQWNRAGWFKRLLLRIRHFVDYAGAKPWWREDGAACPRS